MGNKLKQIVFYQKKKIRVNPLNVTDRIEVPEHETVNNSSLVTIAGHLDERFKEKIDSRTEVTRQ